jgi:nucleotide-binding universal stress UspA family protein
MKILVGVYATPDDAVLKFAGEIARAIGTEVTALYVVPEVGRYKNWLTMPGKSGKPLWEELEELTWVKDKIFQQVDKVMAEYGIKVEKKSSRGSPVDEILKEAEQEEYLLIVLGSTGKKDFSRLMFGSVSYGVAEYAPIPVLVVKKDTELKRFLICTDGSESAEEAEYCAGYLASKLGAEVTALSVAYPGVEPVYTGSPELSEELRREFKKGARMAIQKAAKIMEELGLKVTTNMTVGSAREEIVKESENYDLVVVGSRGLSKIKRVLIGHVSLHVLENADTNVLIVRNCALYRDWKKGTLK